MCIEAGIALPGNFACMLGDEVVGWWVKRWMGGWISRWMLLDHQ